MPRSGTLGNPQPYIPFGVFAGLPFWGGGLTLLAAAPGIGKTSWLLRMLFESASPHIPSAIGCHEAARWACVDLPEKVTVVMGI